MTWQHVIRTYAGHLRTIAEVTLIGGNRTIAEIVKINSGIPQTPKSSRRNRKLLRVESGLCVLQIALWRLAGEIGSFLEK